MKLNKAIVDTTPEFSMEELLQMENDFLRDEIDRCIIGFKITGHFNDGFGDFSGICPFFKNDKTFS